MSHRYVCQEDECGLIFYFSDGGDNQPNPPRYCPCCGNIYTVILYVEEGI